MRLLKVAGLREGRAPESVSASHRSGQVSRLRPAVCIIHSRRTPGSVEGLRRYLAFFFSGKNIKKI